MSFLSLGSGSSSATSLHSAQGQMGVHQQMVETIREETSEGDQKEWESPPVGEVPVYRDLEFERQTL